MSSIGVTSTLSISPVAEEADAEDAEPIVDAQGDVGEVESIGCPSAVETSSGSSNAT